MSAKKSRFDGLDVAAMTSHLKRTMLGFKLANVYDGSALGVSGADGGGKGGGGGGGKGGGVYVLKLADPSGGQITTTASAATTASNASSSSAKPKGNADIATGVTDDPTLHKRAMLLIESGVRFHPTT